MECYGCEKDKVYALMDASTNRVHRFSFSESLLRYIQREHAPHLELRELTIRTGRELLEGEESDSGVYAIIDRRKGKVLRLSLNRAYAAELTRCPSRYIAECWIDARDDRPNLTRISPRRARAGPEATASLSAA